MSAELRLSRFATIVDAGECHVIANVAEPFRIVVDPTLGAAAARLAAQPMSAAAFAAACPDGVDGVGLLALLRAHGVVVGDPAEDEAARRRLVASGTEDPGDAAEKSRRALGYRTPAVVTARDLGAAGAAPLCRVRTLLLGGCVLAFAQEALVREGLAHGLDLDCRVRWPSLRDPLGTPDDDWAPDLAVLQLSIQSLLGGIWDEGPLLAPARRARRAAALERLVSDWIDGFADALEGRLGLVHNVAPPALSPFGRLDFRHEASFRSIAAGLNAAIDAAAARHDHLMVVDEERLVLRHGARTLLDDEIFPFGHHGGALDLEVQTANQRPVLSDLLAAEYLSLYRIHHGIERLRCIVVDLDGTLWPGIAAEDGFDWLDQDTTARWTHLGLHQALRLLKERGILLATASKGTREATLSAWEDVADRGLLRPDDFVDHAIGWGPKSRSVAVLCERLRLQPHQLLFLDDNPVERAEVASRLPAVRTYDADVPHFRALLLTDPRCEVPTVTPEGRERTATTRGALARERLRQTLDRDAFLASLEARVELARATPGTLPRVAELLTRTTQFNTTGRRWTAQELAVLAARDDAALLVARVRDRFADYGLCGAVVVEGDVVTAMVLSCRVIGLEVDLAILRAALVACDRLRPGTRALVTPTPRNEPARDLWTRAGFVADDAPGAFAIRDAALVAQRCGSSHVTVEGLVQERVA